METKKQNSYTIGRIRWAIDGVDGVQRIVGVSSSLSLHYEAMDFVFWAL